MKAQGRNSRGVLIASIGILSIASIACVQFALADGMEPVRRAHVRHHHAHAAPAQNPNTGGNQVGDALVAPTPAAQPQCLSHDDAITAISAVTQGVDVNTINAALAHLSGHDNRPMTDASTLQVSARISAALDTGAQNCAGVTQALNDAFSASQLASAAPTDQPTGAIGPTSNAGAPGPLAPSFSTIPDGDPQGAHGSGYTHLAG